MVRLDDAMRVLSQGKGAPGLKVSRLRVIVTLLVLTGLTALVFDRLDAVDLEAVWQAVRAVSSTDWCIAAFAAAISFWGVANYDLAVHRFFGTGVAAADARRAGFAAIAVSQTLGFSAVTGTILRCRLLPTMSLADVTRLSLAVAGFFLIGWAAVTAIVLSVIPGSPARMPAMLGMCVVIAAVIFCVLRVPQPGAGWRVPNGLMLSRMIALASVDLGFAAISLWWFLPDEIAFTVFLPAFLLAFGAGLVSSAPGGLGAFDLVLLTILPQDHQNEVLAAILAWRAVYYALPAIICAALAIWGRPAMPAVATEPQGVCMNAAPAEVHLVRQGVLRVIAAGPGSGWLAGRTTHGLVAILDPFGGVARARVLQGLVVEARRETRLPMLYKVGARMAAVARAQGWVVVAVAQEAVLNPITFDLGCRERAGLRRKLRRANQAGVTAGPYRGGAEAALTAISATWRAHQGGERGFSMGRYSASYLAGQQVYVARLKDEPIAFASFHRGRTDWTLDLMRAGTNVPDETMQTLIMAALDDARAAGVARVSLAAIPGEHLLRWTARCAWLVPMRGATGQGLRQFKAGFAPQFVLLYAAARGWPSMVLLGAELARAIHRPPSLPPLMRDEVALGEQGNQEFAFAMATPKWHGIVRRSL